MLVAFENTDFIPFHIDDIILFHVLVIVEIILEIALKTVWIVERIVFVTVLTVLEIAFHTVLHIEVKPFQHPLRKLEIAFHTVFITLETVFVTFWITGFILPSHISLHLAFIVSQFL